MKKEVRFTIVSRLAIFCCFYLVSTSCGQESSIAPDSHFSSGPTQSKASTSAGKRSALSSPGEIIEDDTYSTTPGNSTSARDLGWATSLAELASIADTAKMVAGYVSTFVGAINSITALANLAGLIHPTDEVRDLTNDLNAIGTGITWQATTDFINQNYAPVLGAVDALRDEPDTVYPGSANDVDSRNGVVALESNSAWGRASIGSPNDSASDGGSMAFPTFMDDSSYSLHWKDVVPGRNKGNSSLVFDWQMGAPFLLKAIAARLLVMNKLDPNFTTDHAFDAEIGQQHDALLSYYQTMTAGIQCASQDYSYAPRGLGSFNGVPVYPDISDCNIVCADIYSGIAATSTITPIPAQGDEVRGWPNGLLVYQGAYYTVTDSSAKCSNAPFAQYSHAYLSALTFVRQKLPLFQMQSEIDILYRILNPGTDLTEWYGQFESETATSRLCVDFQQQNMAQGVQLQLLSCDGGDSQWWVYNRQTGQIVNPPTGLCVDVQWADAMPGVPVWAWPCTQPYGDPPQIGNPAQKWTYDPQMKRLQNSLGTVLNASGDFQPTFQPTSGALLDAELPTRIGVDDLFYPMQEWHADVPTDPSP